MTWLIILAFTLSSSIDNLGVGLTYGVRSIRIGLTANLLIAFICFLFSEAGILFGKWLSTVLPGIFPELASAFLLTVIGVRVILLTVPRKKKRSATQANANHEQNDMQGILKNPENADVDHSGEIGLIEAGVLGIALSANAITNGLGAGLLGLSPLLISVTAALGSFITIWMGVKLGSKLANIRIGTLSLGQFGTLISGVILLLIAFKAIFIR